MLQQNGISVQAAQCSRTRGLCGLRKAHIKGGPMQPSSHRPKPNQRWKTAKQMTEPERRDAKLGPPFGDTRGGRFTLHAFRRMFTSVGRVFRLEILGIPDWCLKSSWTADQHEEFRRWMFREAMRRMRWRKRQASKEAFSFLLFCGWKIKPTRRESESKPTRKDHGAGETRRSA
jgi:hypothetical protein